MGFRFYRSIKVLPGVRINLSRSGPSVSVGPRGAKLNISKRGTRASVGVQGARFAYTFGKGRRGKRGTKAKAPPPPASQVEKLSIGFFRRLITPASEEALVDGCRELIQGNDDAALAHFRQATDIPDGAFLAGFLSFDAEDYASARRYLRTALDHAAQLGQRLAKWEVDLTVSVPVTPDVTAHVPASKSGALLGMIETCQVQGDLAAATEHAQQLLRLDPDDALVRLSVAELRWAQSTGDAATAKRVMKLAEGLQNDSPIHGAVLLYKARALRALAMDDHARDLCTKLLRAKKGRPADLLQAIRYERAACYEALGQLKRTEKDLETIFLEDPEFEDVAERLGR